jgi:3-oxoacyl-[acyl-carrier protein] reductase
MKKFENQTIIITGGTRGIGRGIAQAFLKEGANVVATYASNSSQAEAFKKENEQYNDKLDIQKFDVTNTDDVEKFYCYLDDNYQSIEVLVNNSGIRNDGLTATMKDEQWSRVIDVNLGGTFNMSRAVITRMMANRYGRIINISSVGGSLGLAGQSNYAASKAGQVALAKRHHS